MVPSDSLQPDLWRDWLSLEKRRDVMTVDHTTDNLRALCDEMKALYLVHKKRADLAEADNLRLQRERDEARANITAHLKMYRQEMGELRKGYCSLEEQLAASRLQHEPESALRDLDWAKSQRDKAESQRDELAEALRESLIALPNHDTRCVGKHIGDAACCFFAERHAVSQAVLAKLSPAGGSRG